MPTVTTFEGFINAMNNAHDGDIILLANDLDFNTWIPRAGTTYPIHCPGTQDKLSNVTINGNGHAIYNITNSFQGTDKGLFYLHTLTNQNNCWVFKNIQFLNIDHNENNANFFRSNLNMHVNWTNQPIVFEDCVFQGVINSPFTYQAYYKRCMFTINSSSGKINSPISNNMNYYEMCWFWLKNVFRMSNDPYIINMKSCYVKGNLGPQATNTNNVFFRNCDSCCINFEANVSVSSAQNKVLSTIVQPLVDTSPKTVVNTDKLKGTSASKSAAIIGVTDEQMHNADALFQLGFDILPT